MDFFYVLVFQKFPDQGQGLLRVVAPEIVDLVDDVVMGFGEQFLEEDVAVKPVGLSEVGWVEEEVLRVSKFFRQSFDSNPSSIVLLVMRLSSGSRDR